MLRDDRVEREREEGGGETERRSEGRASWIRAKLCYSFKFALSDRRHGSAVHLSSLPPGQRIDRA